MSKFTEIIERFLTVMQYKNGHGAGKEYEASHTAPAPLDAKK